MTLNVESELYKGEFLVGTGLQELDKHVCKAEGYLLRRVDEYVAANGCVNVASAGRMRPPRLRGTRMQAFVPLDSRKQR